MADASLVQLSDSGFMLDDSTLDVRGQKVFDRRGNELGSVADLFIDEREKKVRFLEISSGGILGFGASVFLMPVDAVVKLDKDGVRLDQEREHITQAPVYDPNLIDEPAWQNIYAYYGYPPFWGAGYTYPSNFIRLY